jgi:molecular chaperone DnaK
MEFGIDLGTTQSCIAYIDDSGHPVVVKSALGEDTTPSAVFFETPRHAVVGRAARDEALLAPHLVAQLVKRDMGTQASYSFHGTRQTPETVSALILRELARMAAAQTGQRVRDVVITVPANFGIAQREATRRAGELAGLSVLDVLDEPVAAAIHYTAVNGPARPARHALMCDLGGGTLDTAVIRVDGDDIAVVCIDGDARLGGADWDQAIAGLLLGRFEREHPGRHPERDPQFMQDLRIAAERLKRELNTTRSRRHILRFGGAATVIELTRQEVQDLTAGLLDRMLTVIDATVTAARAKGVTRFDEVLLVGGMSWFPVIAGALRERLGVDPRRHEPDLAIAKGAALYARAHAVRSDGQARSVQGPADGRMPGGPAAAPAKQPAAPAMQPAAPSAAGAAPGIRRLAAARIAGVVPRAFGIKGIDGSDPLALSDPIHARQMVVHLLLANTPLPADTGPYTFMTAIPNQRMVEIEVWEQAAAELSDDLADNRKVGRGLLRNLPANLPAGTPVDVTFFLSETGRLTVHAKEQQSGSDVQFDLQIGDFDSGRLREARQAVADIKVDG